MQLQRLADRACKRLGCKRRVVVRHTRAGARYAGWCRLWPHKAIISINPAHRYHRATLAHEIAHAILYDTKHDHQHAVVAWKAWKAMQ